MHMTLSKKLYGAVGVAIVSLIIVAGASFFTQRYLLDGYQSLSEKQAVQKETGMEAKVQLGLAVRALKNYLIRGDAQYVEDFSRYNQAIAEQLDTFEKVAVGDDQREVLAGARSALESYSPLMEGLVVARKQQTDIAHIDRTLVKNADDTLREALGKLDRLAEQQYAAIEKKLAVVAKRMEILMASLALLGIGLAIVFSAWIIRSILRSVNAVSSAAGFAAKGDLSHEVPVYGNDEIAAMSTSFNQMIGSLRQIVGQINITTGTLATSSEELSATSEDLNNGTQEVSSQTDQVVTAMTEVSQTIMDMAKNASSAADASKNASETAAKGRQIVDATAGDMANIARTVQEAATTIEELGRSSAQIGEIVAVINGIADQTNLLALNAAIEAARAGEQGRGFAVVADEVRKLAERSGQATQDIAQRIAAIQMAADESVEAMKRGSGEVDRGVEMAREASAALETIVTASSSAMDMVQRIAAATEQQSAATEEVTQSMENISGVTRHSSASMEQIKSSAADLARVASELKTMTAWFKA